VQVWGIGSEDGRDVLEIFAEQMGITFPVLFDDGAVVQQDYNPGQNTTNSVYPQDWIIGVDGTVVYVSTSYNPEEMIEILEAELAKVE